MNKNQVNGRAKEVEGKVKEIAGRMVGDKKVEEEGKSEDAIGRVQSDHGDRVDAIKKLG